MASVYNVASYILQKQCPQEGDSITTWKLQKLCYYAQAWSLVWDDAPIFQEPIEAWANGPVCPALYQRHVGQFKISSIGCGDPTALTPDQRETVDRVLDYYGTKSAQYLSELTHQEAPWQATREGVPPGERGHKEITLESMAEYYGGL